MLNLPKYYYMPEYLWSRMFLNILGFLICLNKNKDGWINLEHARICLKYNVKDTVKYSIFKREAHSELYQTSKIDLLWKCLIWYYEYTLESEYALR